MILPTETISTEIEDGVLGRSIVDCLESFQPGGGPLSTQEWEPLNQELLDYFGEKSVAAFERRKKELTIRRDVGAGRVLLIGPKDQTEELAESDLVEIGAQFRVTRGDSVTYTLTLDNQGGVAATGVMLRQTLPDYAELVSADGGTLVGDAVGWPAFTLAAGDSTMRTVVVIVDPATPETVSQVSSTATVSDDGALGLDPDLANNSATDTDILEPPPDELPDLEISYDNLVVDPASPQAGDQVSVFGVVRNIGLGTAVAAPVEIYDGDPDDGGVLLHSVLLDDMAPGGNQPFSFQWSATEGVHTMAAVVDPAGSMLEIHTGNNRTERTVLVPRAAGPDLQVQVTGASGVVQSPIDLQMAGQAQVEITNAGDEPAVAPFDVVLYVDADGDRQQGLSETILATATVADDLAAGAVTTVPLDLDASTEFLHPLVWASSTPPTRWRSSGKTTTRCR